MKPAFLPAFAALLLLAACADSPRVAGGVDGNPNFLEGRIELPGTKAPAARVAVVLSGADGVAARGGRAAGWRVLDTAWTDSDGRYRFALGTDGRYRLEARVGDSLLASREIDYDADRGGSVETIEIPLPVGGALLVDDFESIDGKSPLASWFRDAAAWSFFGSDTAMIGILPAAVVATPDSGITDCGAQGRCVHYTATGRAALPRYELSMFSTCLRRLPIANIRLGRADSFVVLARGSGTLNLAVWASDSTGTWAAPAYAAKQFALDSEWTRFALPLDSLCFKSGSDSLPWSATRFHTFAVGLIGVGDLWLDDIRLHGATLLDLQTP